MLLSGCAVGLTTEQKPPCRLKTIHQNLANFLQNLVAKFRFGITSFLQAGPIKKDRVCMLNGSSRKCPFFCRCHPRPSENVATAQALNYRGWSEFGLRFNHDQSVQDEVETISQLRFPKDPFTVNKMCRHRKFRQFLKVFRFDSIEEWVSGFGKFVGFHAVSEGSMAMIAPASNTILPIYYGIARFAPGNPGSSRFCLAALAGVL